VAFTLVDNRENDRRPKAGRTIAGKVMPQRRTGKKELTPLVVTCLIISLSNQRKLCCPWLPPHAVHEWDALAKWRKFAGSGPETKVAQAKEDLLYGLSHGTST
jgi:hypothetical protein